MWRFRACEPYPASLYRLLHASTLLTMYDPPSFFFLSFKKTNLFRVLLAGNNGARVGNQDRPAPWWTFLVGARILGVPAELLG